VWSSLEQFYFVLSAIQKSGQDDDFVHYASDAQLVGRDIAGTMAYLKERVSAQSSCQYVRKVWDILREGFSGDGHRSHQGAL
jgi:hypothetical protein